MARMVLKYPYVLTEKQEGFEPCQSKDDIKRYKLIEECFTDIDICCILAT